MAKSPFFNREVTSIIFDVSVGPPLLFSILYFDTKKLSNVDMNCLFVYLSVCLSKRN